MGPPPGLASGASQSRRLPAEPLHQPGDGPRRGAGSGQGRQRLPHRGRLARRQAEPVAPGIGQPQPEAHPAGGMRELHEQAVRAGSQRHQRSALVEPRRVVDPPLQRQHAVDPDLAAPAGPEPEPRRLVVRAVDHRERVGGHLLGGPEQGAERHLAVYHRLGRHRAPADLAPLAGQARRQIE